MGDITLKVDPREGRTLLQPIVNDGVKISNSISDSNFRNTFQIRQLRTRYIFWVNQAKHVLNRIFESDGSDLDSPVKQFENMSFDFVLISNPMYSVNDLTPKKIDADLDDRLLFMDSVMDNLDIYNVKQTPKSSPTEEDEMRYSENAPIFLVHGRDGEFKERVRYFLEMATGRRVKILSEQANGGVALLNKLIKNAKESCFAVVILSPDDVGGLAGGDLSPRARQNVIFELGLFIGLMGQDRVAALTHGDIEIPSDYSGIAYTATSASWQSDLARELREAGIDASVDRTL